MKIRILCTDPNHPVNKELIKWKNIMSENGHDVQIARKKEQLDEGSILFLVSCYEILSKKDREKFEATLVLHASDLPDGRGWSPHIWQVISGSNEITVSLIEASDEIDRGRVWSKERFVLEGHELLPEINQKLFTYELELMTKAVNEFGKIKPQKQIDKKGNYYRRRVPEDSKLNPDKSISEQFDLLRVVDNERYPAYFYCRGKRYYINIYKEK